MPRLKNISGDDLNIGRPDGPAVKAGDVVAVDGDVLEELDDAYVIGTSDDQVFDPETKERTGFAGGARAWPKATWELIQEPKSANSPRGE